MHDYASFLKWHGLSPGVLFLSVSGSSLWTKRYTPWASPDVIMRMYTMIKKTDAQLLSKESTEFILEETKSRTRISSRFMPAGRSFAFALEVNVSSRELKSLNNPWLHLRFLHFAEFMLSNMPTLSHDFRDVHSCFMLPGNCEAYAGKRHNYLISSRVPDTICIPN